MADAVAVLEGFEGRWWIAGGHAIDLFVGRRTREHGDLDIQILRPDVIGLCEHLRCVRGPLLELWVAVGEELCRDLDPTEIEPGWSLWCRARGGGPWLAQFLVMETEGEFWSYRRCPEIGGPLEELGQRSASGVPMIRPEVQLLFNAGGGGQAKHEVDLRATLPGMSLDARLRLRGWIAQAHGEGHPWLAQLG